MGVVVKNIITTTAIQSLRIQSGDFYTASHLFEDVAAAGKVYFEFKNTSSGKSAVVQLGISHEASATIRSYSGFTLTSEGTDITGYNRYAGEPSSEIVQLRHTPTVSDVGDLRQVELLAGSTAGANQVGGSSEFIVTLIPPGGSVLVELENRASQPQSMSFMLNWSEQNVHPNHFKNV